MPDRSGDRVRRVCRRITGNGVAFAVVASVLTVGVIGYRYAVEFHTRGQGPVHITGAAESNRAVFDGTQMSLSEDSILTVDDTGPQLIAVQEAGEVIYKIRATATRPFILQTAPAMATAFANATLRVAIGFDIEFEVLEGEVKVALRGDNANAPALWLRKGDTWRVPTDSAGTVLAQYFATPATNIDG